MIDVPSPTLMLPDGSMRSLRVIQAARAVEEYDSALRLAQDRETGEWVVTTIRNGHPFPMMGLGDELPAPEKIKEKLWKSDVRRHGAKLVEAIERRNRERQEASKKKADEATGHLVEVMEWGLHQMGASPFPRTYFSKEIPKS